MVARRRRAPTQSTSVVGTGAILTPEQIAMPGSEHSHQVAFFQWIVLTGSKQHEDLVWFYAVPNGGERQAHVGASMRAEGLKRGVPDTCLPVPVGRYAGLYIELKKPGREGERDGGLDVNQVKWCNRLAEAHHAVVVAYGWEQMVAVALRYMSGETLNDRSGPLFVSNEIAEDWKRL